MMNRHSTNPWARLRALLMLPAVALSVIVASASKSDINYHESDDAVEWTVAPDTSEVFAIVEEAPEYPGGTEALLEFIRTNIKYPQNCKDNNIQGRVIVSFVVNKDGSVVEPQVVKGVDPELDAEALRVLSGMPAWTPGKQKGEAVRVKYAVPINFRLTEDQK